MNKKIIIILIIISVVSFSYGISVGHYEIFPYSIISEIKVRIKNIHLRNEPICILSHHEIMKNESFNFIENLFCNSIMEGAEWLSSKYLFLGSN